MGAGAPTTRERARAMGRAEVKPLDVMLAVLANRWNASLAAKKAGDDATQQKEEIAALTAAEKVAPYLHPKLTATTLKGDKENPLRAILGIYSTDQLKSAVRGSK